MLKWIIVVAVAVGIVSCAVSQNREAELQSARNREQGILLAQIESLRTPMVSQLVDDWRIAYPNPSDEKLTELRVIAQRVKADPAVAAEFTKEAKQKSADRWNAMVSSPFSGPMKADGPGI